MTSSSVESEIALVAVLGEFDGFGMFWIGAMAGGSRAKH